MVETGSLCVVLTVLELPASASPVLGLQVCTTMPSQKYTSLAFPISQMFSLEMAILPTYIPN